MSQRSSSRNRSQVDSAAVSFLKFMLGQGKIKANINDDDKTPVWDGDILLFGDYEHTAADVRKVPVQVKGKTVNDLDLATVKYSVKKTDLQNYEKDGGVVFLVVLLKGVEGKIFYRMLLPQDIKPILALFHPKYKTISLDFKAINPQDMPAIMNHFLKNRQINRPVYGFQEIYKKINAFHISGLTQRGEPTQPTPTEQLFTMLNSPNTYIYAVPREFPNERLPIEKNNKNTSLYIGRDLYDHLKIEGKDHNIKGTEIIRKDGKKIFIGTNPNPMERSIVLSLDKNMETNKRVDITIKGTLNERIADLKFADNALKIFEAPNGNKMKELYDNLIALRELFDAIGLKHDINISKFTNENYKQLDTIKRGLNESIVFNELKSNFTIMEVANFECLFLATSVKEKQYKLINPYYTKFQLTLNEINEDGTEGDMGVVPLYFLQKKWLFYKYSNTDYEAIYNELISAEINTFYKKHAINVLLKMLEAYDDEKADDEVLELAIKYAEWLSENTDIDKDYITINRIQALCRLKRIETKDYVMLGALLKSNDNGLRFAAYTLLDDKANANKAFFSLSQAERKRLETYPIFVLYKKLC